MTRLSSEKWAKSVERRAKGVERRAGVVGDNMPKELKEELQKRGIKVYELADYWQESRQNEHSAELISESF